MKNLERHQVMMQKKLKHVLDSDDSSEENNNEDAEDNQVLATRCMTEISNYKNESVLKVINRDGEYSNPLEWWRSRKDVYPMLSELARCVLCIPATSAPTERIFSLASLIISKSRNRLDPEKQE